MQAPKLAAVISALRDPKRWRAWLVEAAIILVIVTGVTLWQNRGLPEGAAPPLAGNRTDGSFVKLGAGDTAHGGNRTTLVVFWATWCPVCKTEAGNIEAVAADWPVVSVAMQSGGMADVGKYLRANGRSVPAIADEAGDIAADWRVRGVPTHFIIDSAGNIRFRTVGYTTGIGLRARLWWASQFPLT